MIDNYSWRTPLKNLVLFLLPWVIIGYLTDHFLLSMVIALTWLVGWHYYHQWQLFVWLWRTRSLTPPVANGAWATIFDGIYKQQKANRKRRRQLGDLIKRFREGAQALPDATIVFDHENTIIWSNKLAHQLLGIKNSDVGQRLNNLIRNPNFEQYQKKGDFKEPIIITSPLNPQSLLEIRIIPYAEQMLFIARDVTKLKQLENMRQDFVANVSHELRTPLTVMLGYLEMMEEPEHTPPAMIKKAIDEMSQQTVRMRDLVEQLLVLSKIESGGEEVFKQTVNVASMLSVVQSETSSLNAVKGHQISFDIDNDLIVYGSETELRSAMSNLIFNAIHYTPDGGTIAVSWKRTKEGALFSVSDNGEGISQKHLARITERFYRVDKARSRKTGGSGLGLSIVKHVLARHYSGLKVSSQVGKGSTFSFTLPNNMIPEKDQKAS
ncbi:phosphate regulon sensor histidine kinase PhoR [Neptunicella marina]|uniref:Phosphate regulon sensor protein PhoR n=1 Tax=Neptunicella marina TaxID=2125989 RepID=A0A8J6ISW4_9ALTE|nr:phosphate regulon sensor histidine kinase PhoR [Neptunicella marina]MBC3764818.1 phosphate regulon sensor histidine kinase PhoR [Neptunicella marina]